MKRGTFTMNSHDGKTKLHGVTWEPEGKVRAVVQIVHGMIEYIERYDGFASYLAERGYFVIGHDHLGHGESAASQDDWGFFEEENGNRVLLEDIHQVRRRAQERYPDAPYILLGHSMGSFVARLYAARYGKNLQALLISGTAGKNPAAGPGKALVALVSLFGGKKGTSKLLYMLTTGNNNKQTEQKTLVDWICHDEEVCRKYIKDPWCSFIFTNSGYGELLELVDRCNRPEWYAAIPKDLPVWLYAGDEDAVGNNGKGVTEVYEGLKAQGLKDVTITLYHGARHEVHNEALKEELFRDIIDYLDSHMPKAE